MNIKERLKNYYNKKSKWNIFSDILLLLLIIAFLIPQSRMVLGTYVNRAKMLIISPSVNKGKDVVQLTAKDYEMVFHDLKGNSKDLSQLKDKVIFINFWATWCPPCVAEMPSIQKLYNHYKDNKSIEFFVVSNEKMIKVRSFAQKKGYKLPFYTNRFQVPKVFSSNSIPVTFVVSKSGKIIMKEIGAANWGSKNIVEIIDKLIKE